MAVDKRRIFSEEDQEISLISKALSHPARVTILKYLAKQSNCVCGDIVDELPLAQSTVSQHLKELKKAGLIQGTIEGPKTCYCINAEKYEKMSALLASFLEEIKNNHKETCC